MLDLTNFFVLFILTIIALQFWRIRGIAEFILPYVHNYCDEQNLQFISLARDTTRFKAYKGKLDWQISYYLHFSSDGETEYVGKITCHGKYVIRIELPPYRV